LGPASTVAAPDAAAAPVDPAAAADVDRLTGPAATPQHAAPVAAAGALFTAAAAGARLLRRPGPQPAEPAPGQSRRRSSWRSR
jgi:hypothetical protein